MGTLTSPMVCFSILNSIFVYFGDAKIDLSPYFMIKTTGLLFVFLLSLNAVNPPDKRAIRCFTRSFYVTVADSLGNFHTTPIEDGRVFVCGDLRMIEYVTHSMEHRPPDTDRYEDRYSYFVFQKDSLMGIEYQAKWPDSTERDSVEPATK